MVARCGGDDPCIGKPTSSSNPQRATIKAPNPTTQPPSPLRNPRLRRSLMRIGHSSQMPGSLRNKFFGKAVQYSQIGCARQVHDNLLYAQPFHSSDALPNRLGTANQGSLSQFG